MKYSPSKRLKAAWRGTAPYISLRQFARNVAGDVGEEYAGPIAREWLRRKGARA